MQANFDNGDFAAAEFVVVSGENGCGNAVVVVAEKNRDIKILHICKLQKSLGQNKTPRNQICKSIVGYICKNIYFL